jgi:hypothetical protein
MEPTTFNFEVENSTFALKMEAADSEMLVVIYKNTWRHNPEVHKLKIIP